LQIDTADELMVTELLFNAMWRSLDTPQLVALLSCMVPCTERNSKDEDAVRLPRSLEDAVRMVQQFAISICEVTNVCSPQMVCHGWMMVPV
jgi:ATP-dependent RNA helicase DOB1